MRIDERNGPLKWPKEAKRHRAAGSHARLEVIDAFYMGGVGKEGPGPHPGNRKISRSQIVILIVAKLVSGEGEEGPINRPPAEPFPGAHNFVIRFLFLIGSKLVVSFWGVAKSSINSIRFELIQLKFP